MFYVCNTFTQYQLSVSAGVTQGLPHANQGSTQHFNPIAAGALATAISLTSILPVQEAPGSLEELPRPGRARQGNEHQVSFYHCPA